LNQCFKRVAALLLLVLPGMATAQTEPASRTNDDLIIAYLSGVPVRIGDFDKGMSPEVFRDLTGPHEDARVIAGQRVINDFRPYALPLLAAKLMPDCQVEPTEEDIKAFYPFWRRALKAGIARIPALGDRAAIAKSEAETAETDRAIGMRTLPMTHLPDLLDVSAVTPGADPIVRQLIRQWRLYHCVQTHYGGEKFFSLGGGALGADWRPDDDPYCLEIVEDGSHALPTPCMQSAEPLSALGALFHDAKDKGLLRFRGPEVDSYFFERYDGNDFANVEVPEKAKTWLTMPPWLVKE
jgi:hypothetical protein